MECERCGIGKARSSAAGMLVVDDGDTMMYEESRSVVVGAEGYFGEECKVGNLVSLALRPGSLVSVELVEDKKA